jgi:hypothetical protein
MKSGAKRTSKKNRSRREKILRSMMASFKIEGINISSDAAFDALKRIELNLGK